MIIGNIKRTNQDRQALDIHLPMLCLEKNYFQFFQTQVFEKEIRVSKRQRRLKNFKDTRFVLFKNIYAEHCLKI